MSLGLPPKDVPKTMAFIRLLGSDKDGEALNAARMLGRILQRNGKDFHDLADLVTIIGKPVPHPTWTPPPDWTWEDEEEPAEPEAEPDAPHAKDLTRAEQLAWLRACLERQIIEDRDAAAAVQMASRMAEGLHSYYFNREQMKVLNRVVKRGWRVGVRI